MRVLRLLGTIGTSAMLITAAQPASANQTSSSGRSGHRAAQVITYTIEPNNAGPTINLIRPNGTGRVGISLDPPLRFSRRLERVG